MWPFEYMLAALQLFGGTDYWGSRGLWCEAIPT
jgi:hypothetical protein